MFYRQPTIKIQNVDGLSFVHYLQLQWNTVQIRQWRDILHLILYEVMLAHGISGEPSKMAYLRAASVHYSWAEISELYLTR